MKTLSILSLCLMLTLSGCKKGDDGAVTPTPAKPDYQVAIEAKYKALGWTQGADNGGVLAKTAGGNGWVQYYGSKDRAIYYFPGKGAFAMNGPEMNTYDAAGQDKWAYVASDVKLCGSGCTYYDAVDVGEGKEAIIYSSIIVSGNIYERYKTSKRWDGPLGLPVEVEKKTVNNAVDKGLYVSFKNGVIWFTPTTGAHATWGKIQKLYVAVDWERSFLKFPVSSCDPNVSEGNQVVRFQGGVINGASCGSYQNTLGETVYQNGTRAANVRDIPCY